ncbi:MAG: hypothetical protein MI919_30220, partial [Holophagales bacterium]|nr:hypothetical protein [Holophagales bacterium]
MESAPAMNPRASSASPGSLSAPSQPAAAPSTAGASRAVEAGTASPVEAATASARVSSAELPEVADGWRAARPWWRRERWLYAFGFFLLGVCYAMLALVTGLDFRLGEADVTLWVTTLLEVSFAGFGYLLGLATEARRGERWAAAEVERRLRELADLRARVAQAEKLASLGQLAGAVAHEVRNPLAILRSMAQNLAEELPGGKSGARRVCEEMIEEIDR